MSTQPKVAVIYYSSTGNTHQLAQAVAQGAEEAGAEVRLRRAAETAPDVAIDSNPAWRAHLDAVADVPLADAVPDRGVQHARPGSLMGSPP